MKFISIVWLICVVFAIYGYVANIIALVGASSYGFLELIRAIGILAAPLGAVMGFVG